MNLQAVELIAIPMLRRKGLEHSPACEALWDAAKVANGSTARDAISTWCIGVRFLCIRA